MKLTEALRLPECRALYDRIVRERIELALGRDITECAADLPPRPRDGSLVDTLLSEPVLEQMRDMADTEVAGRMDAIRSMERHRQRERVRTRNSIRWAQQQGGRARLPAASRAILESMLEPETSTDEPDDRPPSRIDRALAAHTEPEAPATEEGFERVRRGGRLLEARFVAEPDSTGGWRETMARRGCSAETIAALGGTAA